MLETSALYKELLADPGHSKETKITLAGVDYIGGEILFLKTNQEAFGEGGSFAIGKAPARSLDCRLRRKPGDIPDRAELRPYIRLTDGERYSEWIPQGVFFVSNKTVNYVQSMVEIEAHDALLFGEDDYGASDLTFPAPDYDVLQECAAKLAIEVDPRTYVIMNQGFPIKEDVVDGTIRAALGRVAALYCGVFITTATGKLRLLSLYDAPSTELLGDDRGQVLLIGGVAMGL